LKTTNLIADFKKPMTEFSLAQSQGLYDFVYLSNSNLPSSTSSYALVTTDNLFNKLLILSEFIGEDPSAGVVASWNIGNFDLGQDTRAYSLVVMHSSVYIYAKDPSTSCTMIIMGDIAFTLGGETTFTLQYSRKISCPTV
jgi:hypothetical protein